MAVGRAFHILVWNAKERKSFVRAKSGLYMICCTSSGVVGVDFVDIEEVIGQVQGYLSGVVNCVD